MMDINTKIFKQEMNDMKYLTMGAKYMGLKTEGNSILFDSDSEQEAYWDFLTYENINGKSSLFTNAIQNNSFTEKEIEFIKSIYVFDTALYWIEKGSNNKIGLINIITGDSYELYDINLSKNESDNKLIFFRMLNIEDYYMTSGFSFVFCDDIPIVLKREKILSKSEYIKNISITRFRVMNKLIRLYGNTIKYREVGRLTIAST